MVVVLTGGVVGSSTIHYFQQQLHNVWSKDADKRIVQAREEERQELLETEKNIIHRCKDEVSTCHRFSSHSLFEHRREYS